MEQVGRGREVDERAAVRYAKEKEVVVVVYGVVDDGGGGSGVEGRGRSEEVDTSRHTGRNVRGNCGNEHNPLRRRPTQPGNPSNVPALSRRIKTLCAKYLDMIGWDDLR